MIKRNNKRNSIIALIKRDGLLTTDEQEISSEFVTYYTNLLRKTTPGSRLQREKLGSGRFVDDEMKSKLIAPIFFDEIKVSVFDIDDGKSPDPDGYGSLFFKKTWDEVGCTMVEAVDELFRTVNLLK